jgi:hypothetical protein
MGTERPDPVLPGQNFRIRAETESVKAARSAPEGLGLEGRVFGRYAGDGGAHGCFSGHAPCHAASGRRVWEGEHPPISRPGYREIPATGAQKEYSVNYAFRCLKTVDMYRECVCGP